MGTFDLHALQGTLQKFRSAAIKAGKGNYEASSSSSACAVTVASSAAADSVVVVVVVVVVVGQASALHAWWSKALPGQSCPPFLVLIIILRFRCLDPPPQLFEQLPHADQSDQLQSILQSVTPFWSLISGSVAPQKPTSPQPS